MEPGPLEGRPQADRAANAAEDARFRALVAVLGKLVTEPHLEATLASDATSWLAQQGIEPADAAMLAAQGSARLVVYRKLVRSGLEGALRVQLPRTVKWLGSRLGRDVDRFCSGAMARSHFLRDVPREWVAFARPGWAAETSLPAHLGDLAQHELSAFEICAAPPSAVNEVASSETLDPSRPVAFDVAVRMYTYDFPVHEIDDEVDGAVTPRRSNLLGYRDAEHDARYLELTGLAAALTSRLLRQEPLGAAVALACAEVGLAMDATSLGRVATFFADLAERRILLGTSA